MNELTLLLEVGQSCLSILINVREHLNAAYPDKCFGTVNLFLNSSYFWGQLKNLLFQSLLTAKKK